MITPELVSPAGNMEKLKTAFLFGADAVYLGGEHFSLRAAADNFTPDEIKTAVQIARQQGKRVYITLNIFARNRDLEQLIPYLESLAAYGPDGLIISDPGVMRLALKYAPEIPLTVSTQANVTNYETAAFYRDLGAGRIVLARELSLSEMVRIKEQVDIELEVFVHGAMCVSYSGRCLLSQFMTGRSANQGLCAHPCRYAYALVEEKRPDQYFPVEEDARGTYIMNSLDLCLLEHIPLLIDAGIDAFKIEGRMKSPLYVAVTAQVYRQAIDRSKQYPGRKWQEHIEHWQRELGQVATRPFTSGFIDGDDGVMQDYEKDAGGRRAEFCGVVREYMTDSGLAAIEQRSNFGCGDMIEFMMPGEISPGIVVKELYDESGQLLDRARHPQQMVFLPVTFPVSPHSIVRKIGHEHV